jgi:sigma-B regulation protein RsbU (phosphoserine phosphatase)
MLRAVERILAADHDVVCVASPADALAQLESTKPDLAICDIGMPRMDGFELMDKLKRARPDLDVILMTGMSDPDTHMVRAIREKAFYFIEKPFNREVMRTLVERCLELRRLRDERRRNRERIDRELAEARSLQQTMIPPMHAIVQRVVIDARCVACSELGGDIFDYADAGKGCAAVMVADVAGHGVSAAMLTAVVKSAFRSSAADAFEPRSVVRRIARDIAHFSARRFVTLFVARINALRRTVEFVNAGHPPAVMWRDDLNVRQLEPTGPLISPAFGDDEWEQQMLDLHEDGRLLLYTDGVTEATGADHSKQFARDRLIEQVRQFPRGGEPLLDGILGAVRAHAGGRVQLDDFTLLTASLLQSGMGVSPMDKPL